MATLEQIHLPSTTSDRPHVIFVHGLGGHPRETWMANVADAASLWPCWIGEELDCATWVLGYDAELSGWKDGAMPLPAQGVAVLDCLSSEPALSGRRIVLVGHSMGGLVIKMAMRSVETRGDARYRKWLHQIAGVVFVATPHRGSELATLAEAVKVLLRTNPQVGNMSAHDGYLGELQDNFRDLQLRLQFGVRSYSEQRGVTLRKRLFGLLAGSRVMVVPPAFSDPGIAGIVSIPLAEDHFSICKPGDRRTQIHLSLVQFLREIFNQPLPKSAAPHPAPSQPAGGTPTESARPAPERRRPGLIRGREDNRLLPREGRLYGREQEIADVLAFLRGAEDSAVVCGQVVGSGGIGKTEVCKAALRQWIGDGKVGDVWYVDVPDAASPAQLLAHLAQAVGAGEIQGFDDLAVRLGPGLYYLDNLESIVDHGDGVALLGQLRQLPGIRLLASSRVQLPREFGRPLMIDTLPPDDACKLFRASWSGAPDGLPVEVVGKRGAVEDFVIDLLGCHPLSIALMARLGDVYSLSELFKSWNQEGVAVAAEPGATRRQDSLAISLALTTTVLRKTPGTLPLWVLVSMYAEGIDAEVRAPLSADLGIPESARGQLVRHHVLLNRSGRLSVLPPLARYALACASRNEQGFAWRGIGNALLQHFLQMATAADSIASSSASLAARESLLAQWPVLLRLIQQEAASTDPSRATVRALAGNLRNLFQFRAALSVELLESMSSVLGQDALVLGVRGDLERRHGRVDAARGLYDRALSLYEKEQDSFGQANTLKSLGDLESRLGRIDAARALYDRSLSFSEQEHDDLGQANALKSLGDLERFLSRAHSARGLYDRALLLFEREKAGLGQANTLKSLGDLEMRLGHLDTARELYDRVLSLFEHEQDCLGQANTLQSLGDLESRLGRVDAARRLYGRSLSLFEKEQVGLGQANTRKSLGDLEMRLGQLNAARELYDRALSLFEHEREGQGQANTLQSLGDLEMRLGRVDAARGLYGRALSLFEQGQAGLEQANTLKSLGDLERRLGRVTAARELYDRALPLFEQKQDGLGQANTLLSLGDLERFLGGVDVARELYNRSLLLFEQEQARLGQANTLKSLGDLERRLGQADAALVLYDRALLLFEQEQDGLGQANTLQSLGDLERHRGHVEAARGLYDRALSLYGQEQDQMGLSYTLAEVARCEAVNGRMDGRDTALRIALTTAHGCGAPPVVEYIGGVLAELLGSTEEAQQWINEQFGSQTGSG